MRHTLALMLVVVCLGGCGIAAPSATTEVLILNADYSFVQIYATAQPTRRYEGQGTWRVEQRASGCVYVHLEGMRFFYGSEAFEINGNRFTPDGEPYRFWERCEDQRIQMPDKEVLIVTDRLRWARGIGLLFPSTASDPGSSESESLILTADEAGVPLPRPTPPRP
jgi:hypothetical protein